VIGLVIIAGIIWVGPPKDPLPPAAEEQNADSSAQKASSSMTTQTESDQDNPLPKVVHVPNGDVQDDAEAYRKKLIWILKQSDSVRGTDKKRFGQGLWLFKALLERAAEAGYQGGVGAHFVDLVDREMKAAGLDGIP